ncbi:MAG: hypothetical protein ACM37W_22960 [Actinomycetota bacterium]
MPTLTLPKLSTPLSHKILWNADNQIRIWLPGQAKSKLRTRSQPSGRGVYNPAHYKRWKSEAAFAIYRAFWEAKKASLSLDFNPNICAVRGNVNLCPIECACVEILFVGGHRGDPSNRLNAILDLLLSEDLLGNARLIKNDSTNKQPEGSYQCDTSSQYTGSLIVITPSQRQKFTADKLDSWGSSGW